MSDSGDDFLSLLDLTEYEAAALEELLLLGRTTAPDLAEATGIPKARIYGVLDSLSEAGYVKIIPGRPKRYQPHDPSGSRSAPSRTGGTPTSDFARTSKQSKNRSWTRTHQFRDRGVDDLSPTEDLFHVVDVGEPSERETRRLFREAEESVYVLTKSFGYIDAVRPAMRDAIARRRRRRRCATARARTPRRRTSGAKTKSELLAEEFPPVSVRISDRVLPWRGTFIDPSLSSTTVGGGLTDGRTGGDPEPPPPGSGHGEPVVRGRTLAVLRSPLATREPIRNAVARRVPTRAPSRALTRKPLA